MCGHLAPCSSLAEPCLPSRQPSQSRQRICEDVRNYVNTSVLLTVAVMRKLLNCLAFTGVYVSITQAGEVGCGILSALHTGLVTGATSPPPIWVQAYCGRWLPALQYSSSSTR